MKMTSDLRRRLRKEGSELSHEAADTLVAMEQMLLSVVPCGLTAQQLESVLAGIEKTIEVERAKLRHPSVKAQQVRRLRVVPCDGRRDDA